MKLKMMAWKDQKQFEPNYGLAGLIDICDRIIAMVFKIYLNN
jgi:hypothetical protein